MESGDASLVEQLQKGDDTAFAHLVMRYRDAVCGIAFHYLRNREDAQDAAQETFIQAYHHLSDLRDVGRFAPWLRRMAVNQCLDILRRRKRDCLSLPRIATPESPPDLSEIVGRRLLVQHALAQLSPRLRLTFTLCYIGEYAHEEIARFLDVPVGTVRSRLRLARQQLRQEMEKMAAEALEDIRPDGEWTRKVVEAAILRGSTALGRHERGEAVRAFDDALAALGKLETTEPARQIQQWTLDILRQKDVAAAFTVDSDSRLALLEQARATARTLGDEQAEAEILLDMGRVSRSRTDSAAYYTQALTLFRERGDIAHQAECLLLLGSVALFENDAQASKGYISDASALFEQTGTADWQAVCIALLEILAKTETTGLERLLLWAGMCDGLDTDDGKIRFASQPGFQSTRRSDDHPAALFVGSVFWQLSALRTFLDSRVPVDGSWAGNVSSFSHQPLQASLCVVGASETISVPAGTFTDCLLTELVTLETDAPDDAPERLRLLNRTVLCGRRRAWYAPGVGLIQLHITPEEGPEVEIQLQACAINGGDGYLPLAPGNTWTYGWANIPYIYVAQESYQVTAQTGNRWHLAHWAFAC